MTTLTDKRACENDSGLLARDCDCDGCDSLREDFIKLHIDMAKAWLANRGDNEREEHVKSILGHIERYRTWL